MNYDIISEITSVETIAVGSAIREIERPRKIYGHSRWRKMKGIATIRFRDGTIVEAEVHWYEAYGIGKREEKIKRIFWGKR